MSHKSALPNILGRELPKHERAVKEAGWKGTYIYRARTEDPSFEMFDYICEVCGERHSNPLEGNPHYIQKTVPKRVAKKWAKYHGVSSYIERKEAFVHKKLGKRTVATGTWVKEIQAIPSSEWEIIKVIRPSELREG
ncbi:MAG: hypothetical protein PHU95_05730 [Candidatus Thermoplasmatota archaeon]|nr:hypothetical protein [Candidatus Thermoplasmatota archaeon]MDD5778927.1 hypothetical protein [Candidatus Thermoplasmatota archaeon]